MLWLPDNQDEAEAGAVGGCGVESRRGDQQSLRASTTAGRQADARPGADEGREDSVAGSH